MLSQCYLNIDNNEGILFLFQIDFCPLINEQIGIFI
jgi:hypothetical protein